MRLENTPREFGLVSRVIHMAYAAIFLSVIALVFMEQFQLTDNFELTQMHSSLGVLTLVLLLVRVLWFRKSKIPNPLGGTIEKLGAKLAHAALFFIMLVLPVSGLFLAMSKARDIDMFGLFTIPGFAERNASMIELSSTTHEYLVYLTYAILIAHVGFALIHHFIFKDATFTRMFGKMS